MMFFSNDRLLSVSVLQYFLYLIWYTTMSIFGHFNNFFFAAHLLDIAMGFKTLRTILSSVTHNGKQVSAPTTPESSSWSGDHAVQPVLQVLLSHRPFDLHRLWRGNILV
uniref:RYR3 n=1 Tax=Poeciliopsis prolifica TaxID=188132 RepID=A0A0S7ENN7_9TELE